MKNIEVKVIDTVLKPIEDVFDAIINPDKLTGFFISKSSGALVKGETLTWFFEDVNVKIDVTVIDIIKYNTISFVWEAIGEKAEVTILLNEEATDKTKVTITEKSFLFTESGVQKALGQTQGWTDFLCSLKAYLYCGINLRNGRSIR